MCVSYRDTWASTKKKGARKGRKSMRRTTRMATWKTKLRARYTLANRGLNLEVVHDRVSHTNIKGTRVGLEWD